eukprot:3774003-Pleurochrysis_carterae.AAC.2
MRACLSPVRPPSVPPDGLAVDDLSLHEGVEAEAAVGLRVDFWALEQQRRRRGQLLQLRRLAAELGLLEPARAVPRLPHGRARRRRRAVLVEQLQPALGLAQVALRLNVPRGAAVPGEPVRRGKGRET